MTCFNPKYAQYTYGQLRIINHYKDQNGKKIDIDTGKTKLGKIIKFQTKANFDTTKIGNGSMIIPCGKCLGCKLDKASELGTRALIEANQWKNNFFLTLTYNDENLPKNGSLCKKDVQDFLKRLREKYSGIQSREWKGKIEYPIRMYYCGEYGPKGTRRPHYHLAIFNWIPNDLKLLKVQKNGIKIFTSEIIEREWGKGFHTIEELNYESASYIARYTIKKMFNNKDEYCKSKGITPEFVECSRKGGIGYQLMENKKEWEKAKRNYGIYTWTRKGIKLKKIPTYYKNKWRENNDIEYFEISDMRRKEMENEINEMLKRTTLTKLQYIQQQKDLILLKTKNTTKRQQL